MKMIIRSQPKDSARIIRFVSRIFVASEPTSVALNFTECDFITAFQDVMRKCVQSNHSFSYLNGGDIVAQSLSVSYDVFSKANYGYTRETQPMFDLFDKLETYRPSGKCLVMFALCSEFEGRGIASRLLRETIENAKNDGYQMIIADCTNIVSQHIFKRHDFKTVVEVKYRDFDYGIRKPFKDIETTESIQRMIYDISTESSFLDLKYARMSS